MDTTAFSGLTGWLAFDFVGGDTAVANNSVSVGALATNGALTDTTNFSLSDTTFFNEVLREITFGTLLTFEFSLTTNHSPAGVDQFSFFLLDSSFLLPLGATTDPLGADALFAVDIDGTTTGNLAVFGSLVPGARWTVTPQGVIGVPDTGATAILFGFAICVLLSRRRSPG